MAGVLYGKDVFTSGRIKIAEKIEADKLRQYYRKHGLNKSEVRDDIFEFAVSQNKLCKFYSDLRYESDKYDINNIKHVEITNEAKSRYQP